MIPARAQDASVRRVPSEMKMSREWIAEKNTLHSRDRRAGYRPGMVRWYVDPATGWEGWSLIVAVDADDVVMLMNGRLVRFTVDRAMSNCWPSPQDAHP